MRPTNAKRVVRDFISGKTIAQVMAFRKISRKQAEDAIRDALVRAMNCLIESNVKHEAEAERR
jgi:hypothetical protein